MKRLFFAERLPPIVLSCLLATGCQFFFPLPVESEVDVQAPTQAVRAIGEPFEEGERLVGRVFVEDVAAGTVELRAGKKCIADGKLALPLAGAGDLGGLLSFIGGGNAKTAALIDLDASLPLEAKWDTTVDGKRSFIELTYEPGSFAFHHLKEAPEKKATHGYRNVRLSTEQTPHDGHSLLGYLRRWDPPEGAAGYTYAVLNRVLYRVDVAFTGRERLSTVLGEQMARRIDGTATKVSEKTLEPVPQAKDRPFVLFITDDDDRIPLRISVNTELAAIVIDLDKRTVEPVASGAPGPCEVRVDAAEMAKARVPKKRKKKDRTEPKVLVAPFPPKSP